jgi:hypothetical protein
MKIPKGQTEDEVVRIMTKVASGLGYKFQFGYHSIEDMKQMGIQFAIEALDKYDETRPLENFLWIHVFNRLYNEKRNKYSRPNTPCYQCPLYNTKLESQCENFADRMECNLYNGWFTRNESKKNLMSTLELDNVNDEYEENMRLEDEDHESKELIGLIDSNVSIEFRQDWLRLRDNLKLSKVRRTRILEEISLILEKYGIQKEEW